MYTIGEFSKIGSVSTKTLRYYDEIGLLHPAHVDENNRYRYYTEEQVDEILYISELKQFDLRLEQIKAVMEQNEKSLLEHFLTERIRQINDQVQDSIRLRQCIEKKIQEIQSGEISMEKNAELLVEAKEFQPVWAMSKKAVIKIDEIGTVIGSVFETIFKNGLKPAGPVMTFYLDEEFNHEHAEVEVCVPVAPDKCLDGIEGIKKIQPGLCAFCTYRGVYSKLGKAYAAVLKWIGENKYEISSSPFDCYMNSPQDIKNPEELITQVWFPIK
ncbi:MAG: MerR family transcriptional regulator [Lachnospiraceae bacterium]|nr:MerR family transcriptional regulator [Lachnospiraceae bacterium]